MANHELDGIPSPTVPAEDDDCRCDLARKESPVAIGGRDRATGPGGGVLETLTKRGSLPRAWMSTAGGFGSGSKKP